MIVYKVADKYYLEVQNSTSSTESLIHCKSITDGEDLIINLRDEDSFEYAPIEHALPEFFRAQWIGNPDLEKMTMAMMQEVSEAFNELDWKPWKSKPVNLDLYKDELADVGIFLLLCSKSADMTLDELLFRMIRKHLYNLIRLDHDRRHLANKKGEKENE